MEQKTEASQSVGEKPHIRRWQDRLPEGVSFSYGYAHIAAMKAEIADLRAALKAQPAPTEAFDKPFDPKDETIKRLQGLIAAYEQIIAGHAASEKRAIKYSNSAQIAPTEAAQGDSNSPEFDGIVAQGEDSVRLDFIEKHAIKGGTYKGITSANVILHEGEWHELGLRAAIDAARARASAETGGVKS